MDQVFGCTWTDLLTRSIKQHAGFNIKAMSNRNSCMGYLHKLKFSIAHGPSSLGFRDEKKKCQLP